jgi:XTP/dITP diphosphohydrolase
MREVWPEIVLVEPQGDAPDEDGTSFRENALIKARAAHNATGLPAIADDSGMCVDALGGEPGIDSAHYSGERDDTKNLELVLERMTGVAERGASFVCAAAIVDERGEDAVESRWPGVVTESSAGSGGFGYDPIFMPDGHAVTAAELSAEEKNRMSHRGQAFRALATVLKNRYGLA